MQTKLLPTFELLAVGTEPFRKMPGLKIVFHSSSDAPNPYPLLRYTDYLRWSHWTGEEEERSADVAADAITNSERPAHNTSRLCDPTETPD